MTTVSVAMATFNGEELIEQQLVSLATQNHQPAELVVTDDASSDGTLSILERFSKSSRFPVRIHRNENRLGYRGNFIRAASLCTSDLIAFCDQDDQWYPSKIARCVQRFTEPDILLVYHDADVVTENGEHLGGLEKFSPNQSISAPLTLAPLAHSPGFTQVFRRSLLALSDLWPMSVDHQFENERMAHDQWFYFLASVLGKIAYVNEPLAAYVQHGRNAHGFGRPANQFQKIQRGLEDSVEQVSRRAAATSSRAIVLEAARIRLNATQSEKATIAAHRYRRLSELNLTRREIYTSQELGRRFKAFLRLSANRAYGGEWNLSWKALVKDISVGVPLGPFFRRETA